MSAKRVPQSVARKQHEQSSAMQSTRTVVYFSLAIVSMLLLLYLDRCINTPTMLPIFRRLSLGLMVGFGLSVIACGAVTFKNARQETTKKLLSSEVLLLLSTVGFLSCLFIRTFYSDGTKLLYVVIPGMVLLYIIRLIYGNPFCFISSFLLFAGSLLYVFNRQLQMGLFASLRIPFGLLLIAMGALFTALCVRLRRSGGTLHLQGHPCRLFQKSDSYLPAMLAGALTVLLGGLFMHSAAYALFYGVIALGALLVLMGLYYTYGLMYS